MVYLVIKALHIVFVVSWFAGLFYLPRLFVNHAMAEEPMVRQRLVLMERKLFRFMTPLGVLAIGLGLWLWFGFGLTGGWLHVKTVLVVLLAFYHAYCGKLMNDLAVGRDRHSHVWFRFFNEIPVLLLLMITLLVVLKPF